MNIKSPRSCKMCGSQLEPEATACSACGEPTEGSNALDEVNSQETGGGGWFNWILLVMFGFSTVAGVIRLGFNSDSRTFAGFVGTAFSGYIFFLCIRDAKFGNKRSQSLSVSGHY
jgi:hypothetical protein